MSQVKNFLNFIFTPKEIYAVLDKFGYKSGNSLIRAVIQKGYAEKKDHKIVLTKLGKSRLNELENLKNNPPIEIQDQPIQEMPAPANEKTTTFLILGIVGLLGFIFSVWQVLSSKIFMPYGIIGIFFLVLFIFSIILFLKESK